MRVISRKTLREFWERPSCRDAEQPLKSWFREGLQADCATPADVKASFRSASIVRNGRAVFNIAGNKYRLVVRINYAYRVAYVRFVGTHEEYARTDVETV